MSLQSATLAAHQNAERTEFAREMMSGNMSQEKYKTFLWNIYLVYDLLEDVAASMGAFGPMDPSMPEDDLPLDGLKQADDILADFQELGGDVDNPPATVQATEDYRNHIIKDIQHDRQRLMTHIYVNHMGDLSGGQMLAKKIPGSGKMYKFEDMDHSVEEMKNLIRKRVSEDDAIEANIAFGFRTQQYEQLNDLTYSG
tara:strand:- start:377 stop:970 length:594 start_codon:yes stop_codon:yes gene_type:complete